MPAMAEPNRLYANGRNASLHLSEPMIKEVNIRILPRQAVDERRIGEFIARELGFDVRTITAIRVLRRSIDARQRTVMVNLKVRVYINEQPTDIGYTAVEYRDVSSSPRVIVVGAGPGGLFASLRLIELGLRPVLIERGKDVHERRKDIALISKNHKVDADSNYCFGAGGAGAFSDGKLFTRSHKRGNTDKVLNVLCQHGAPLSILSDAHPHIGTDRLPRVVENILETIAGCGGEVHLRTRMTRLIVSNGHVEGIEALSLDTANEEIYRGNVILATGHSARDVYNSLHSDGVEMEPKSLAVGVRLEHPSALIDRIQYHSREGRGAHLPAAEYNFVTQVDGRGVYSFCMCPGGFVIPSATARRQIVVNGMSPSNRGSQWSNSGMVVELRVEDVPGDDDVLKMMKYQEALEQSCWQQGNMRQTAPAQRMVDFVNNKLSYDLPHSSYAPGLISSPLHFWLPKPIATRLQQAFSKFGRMSHGFLTNDAVVIGVETRTSAPLRITRDSATLQHVRLKGLFPCGEGAGYAGGIVSAAVDGERCADMAAAAMNAANG